MERRLLSAFILICACLMPLQIYAESPENIGDPKGSLIGSDDFARLFKAGGPFVDKTLLIKDFLEGDHFVTLVTRPRRWGKTINLSMLRYFLHQEMDSKGDAVVPNPYEKIFKGLDIGKENTTVRNKSGKLQSVNFVDHFQGQYPVIFLSLKDVKQNTYEAMRESIKYEVVRLYSQYKYLTPISKLWKASAGDEDRFTKEIEHHLITNKTLGLEKSLVELSRWLFEHHKQHVYLLIDEYDTPLNEAFTRGYSEKAIAFMGDFLGSVLKSNSNLEKGFLTGILRIAKVKLLSDLNNLGEDTVLETRGYAPHFGFTETEVNRLLNESQPGGNFTQVKDWYNGYRIGNETLYNPWSVMNYLSSVRKKALDPLREYWVDSGGVDLIKSRLFSNATKAIWESVESGDDVSARINKHISPSDLNPTGDLHSILFHAGYLTLGRDSISESSNINVRIPNKEVRNEFERLAGEHLRENHQVQESRYVKRVFEAIIAQDIERVRAFMEEHGPTDFRKWNYNFLHIAALVGNTEIFELIWAHEKGSRDSRSQEDLSVADFAVLGGKKLPREGKTFLSPNQDSFHRSVCWAEKQASISSFIASLAVAVPLEGIKRWAGLRWASAFSVLIAAGLQATARTVSPSATELMGNIYGYVRPGFATHCDMLGRFYGADVSRAKDFVSLVEFGRYVATHPGSNVALNSACRTDQQKITQIQQHAIAFDDAQFMRFTFTLCGAPVSRTEVQKNNEL